MPERASRELAHRALVGRVIRGRGFAIYLASRDGYQDSVLLNGNPIGTAQDALDCAGDLYLTDLSP